MYSNVFDLSLDNIAHSRTGGPGFIKTETAFGLMAYGVGEFKKEAFIILRGTKILADLLTDFNAMWSSTSVQGYKIHEDRKSTRLNSSHVRISYAVFCLKKKKNYII